MPAKNQLDPGSLPGRIRAWLAEHPGDHRPRDVAKALGVPDGSDRSRWTIRVGAAMSRMYLAGELTRRRDVSAGGATVKRPPTLYALAPPGEE